MRTCSLFAVAGLGGLAISCGGINQLPPPATPPQELPQVADANRPLVPHMGRVIIDSTRAAAQVDEVTALNVGFEDHKVTDGYRASLETRTLCNQTPCAVDLPYGPHILRYTTLGGEAATSITTVRVEDKPIGFRHTMGHYTTHPTMQAVGGAALTTGIVLVAVSIPLLVLGSLSLDDVLPDSKDTQSTFSTIGTVMISSGLVLSAVGIILKVAGRDEIQRGTSTQWQLGPAVNPPPSPAPVVAPPAPTTTPLPPPSPTSGPGTPNMPPGTPSSPPPPPAPPEAPTPLK